MNEIDFDSLFSNLDLNFLYGLYNDVSSNLLYSLEEFFRRYVEVLGYLDQRIFVEKLIQCREEDKEDEN